MKDCFVIRLCQCLYAIIYLSFNKECLAEWTEEATQMKNENTY